MLFVLKKISVSRFFFILVLLINTQFLALYGLNPIGIYGFQEAFFVFSFFVSILYFLKFGFSAEEILIFFIPLLALIFSAIFSYYWFDQPYIYAVMEYRRVFGLYIFFIFIWAIRVNIFTVDSIINWFVFISLLLGICNILFSGSAGGGISQESIERTGIGQHFVAMGSVICFWKWVNSGKMVNLIFSIFLFLVLLLVVQSRQIAIATLLVMPIVMNISSKSIPLFLLFFTIVLGVGYYEPFQDAILERLPRVAELVDNGVYEISEGARGVALYEVFTEFQSTGWFFGHGGLYKYWNGGFEPIYGPNFILADIGLVGGLYRLGIVYVLLLIVYFRLQVTAILKIEDQIWRKLLWALFFQLLIMSPMGSLFSYRGHVAGILIALAFSLSGYYYKRSR